MTGRQYPCYAVQQVERLLEVARMPVRLVQHAERSGKLKGCGALKVT